MYTLYFPNGNVQTYSNSRDLQNAAALFGGKARLLSGNAYAFIS